MKKIILITCISALTLTYSINTQAKIYKWTDAKGVIHYSATPPATKKKVKNIESDIRLAAGKHRPSEADKKEANTDNKQKAKEQEDEASELSPPDKKLIDYCKSQRDNLKILKKNFRNVWIDSSGKRTKLNQKQRQEKVDYIKNRIENDCGEVENF